MIRAVVFDYGGVLSDTRPTQERLLSFDARLGWPPGTLRERLFAGETWELASIGAISPEEHWARVGQPLEQRLPASFRGLRGDPFYFEPVNEAVLAVARRISRSCRLALCSNALPDLARRVDERPEIAALFEAVVISSLVGVRKPDRSIFELTADRLQLSLADCLLVDDKVRNVRAARAAGMAAVRFSSAAELVRELESMVPDSGAFGASGRD